MILVALVAFFISAIPFSVLVGWLVARVDIRKFGDGNPGATNVLRATQSKFWFLIAVNLDICKGLIPVALAYWYAGYHGLEIALIALASIAGHAFSPFLKFDGGKAIATSYGVWMALTYFETMIPQAILLVYCFLSVDNSDWAVMLTALAFLLYALLAHGLDATWLTVMAGNFVILLFKHRKGLAQPPHLRRWLPFLSKHTPAEAV
jgi:acyl phosphate:glycerol-3-phosphate acyltransferase